MIQGRVLDEQGDPVPGAELRIFGYAGSDSLGTSDDDLVTAPDGSFRADVGTGLYEVHGTAFLEHAGQRFRFTLDPVDGACDQAMADDGIVEDFVLRLRGLQQCGDGVDPANPGFYHGGAVTLFQELGSAWSPAAVVTFALAPQGPLADGSPGTPLTMTRTLAAFQTYAGPLDGTNMLYDVPLGSYQVTASIAEPGGAATPLLVRTGYESAPAQAAPLQFEAEIMEPYGYRDVTLTVSAG